MPHSDTAAEISSSSPTAAVEAEPQTGAPAPSDASTPNSPSEAVPADEIRALAALIERARASENSPESAPDDAGASARLAEILRAKRGNGLSLEDAVAAALAAEDEAPPSPPLALIWENPLADTANVRERKFSVAAGLGEAFPKTGGALARAAGAITAAKWSAAWQSAAEEAAENFAAAAENLSARAADFTAATGLLPAAGTLSSFRALLRLVSALLAARGEDGGSEALVLGAEAEKTLASLREAAMLVECAARHKALLSLPYPEDACEDSRLKEWFKIWTDSEFSRTPARWMKRRKIFRALRELAGGTEKDPLDPRVDLGNLIAIRNCRLEFSEKFSGFPKKFPTLFRGFEPCGALARIDALERARAGTAAALKNLENVPEKRDAWRAVFSRCLGGSGEAFRKGGDAEKALAAAQSALEAFEARRGELFEKTGVTFSPSASGAEDASAFAREMLADRASWRDVCAWNSAAIAAERRGMAALASAVRAGTVPAGRARDVFVREYCRRWAAAVVESEPELLEIPAAEK